MNNKLNGYIAAVVATMLLGCLGIFVRNIEANAYIITFSRVGIGFVFLAAFLALQGKLKQMKLSWELVVSGILLAATSLCYIQAISETTLANAVFLLYLGPLIAVGVAAVILKEKLTILNGCLIALAFVGFLFLLEFDFSFNSQDSKGYMWGIASGLCHALYIILNRRIPQQIPAPIRSFYQLLFGALIIIPFLDRSIFNVSTKDIAWLIAIGFFHGFLAFSLIIYSLKHLKAVQFGTIVYVEPLVASLIGILLYGESLSILQAIGCALVMAGGLIQVVNSNKS